MTGGLGSSLEWSARLRIATGCYSADKQKVWTPYSLLSPLGFARAFMSGLLHLLSDCWGTLPTSGWPQYPYDPFGQGYLLTSAKPLQVLVHVLLLVFYYLAGIVCSTIVAIIILCFGPVVVWLRAKGILFWVRAIRLRLHEFFWTERRGGLPVGAAEAAHSGNTKVPLSSATLEWRYTSPTVDYLFSVFVICLYYIEFNSWMSCVLLWDFATSADLIRKFRKFLGSYPPPFRIEAYDLPYLQDSPANPCQIVLLAVTERLTLDEMHHLVMSRWVKRHRKLRSVPSHLFGLPCWNPLRTGTDTRSFTRSVDHYPFQTEEGKTFHVDKHVTEMDIDLKETSVYEALSDFGAVCLPRNQPLWRIVLFQPSNSDVAVRVRQPGEALPSGPGISMSSTTRETSTANGDKETGVIVPARSLSFIACQIHHSLGDGVAVASSLVNSLFDPQPDLGRRLIDGQVAKNGESECVTPSRPEPPKSLAALYYAIHFVRAIWYIGGQIIFCAVWSPDPPALFQPPRKATRDKDTPPGHLLLARPPTSGRKFFAPPMVFEANEVRQLCNDIGQLLGGIRPTVNDLFSHCLAVATGRLRSGAVIAELQYPLSLRQLNTERELSVQDLPAQVSDESLSSLRRYSLSINTCSSRIHTSSEDMSPMTIRGYTGELSADLKLMRTCSRLPESFAIPNAYYHRYASDFENYVSIMIPMTCRLTPPAEMDNFTSLVMTRFPTLTATESRLKQEGCVRSRESAAFRLNLSLRNLLAIKGELDWLKMKNYRPMVFTVVYFMMETFPNWLSKIVCSVCNSGLQMYFTNVVGPASLLTLGGHPVWSLQSWPPSNRHVSTAIKLLTYGGDIQFLVAVDENELLAAFSARDLVMLTRRDLLTITSVVGELVWDEFHTLKELVEAALRAIHQAG